jgi:hypothetical protein
MGSFPTRLPRRSNDYHRFVIQLHWMVLLLLASCSLGASYCSDFQLVHGRILRYYVYRNRLLVDTCATHLRWRPTITKYAVLISGRGQSTKRPHNRIDFCTDRIAPAQTDGVRRPTRLTEVCREGYLVPMLASVLFVNGHDWSRLPDSSG